MLAFSRAPPASRRRGRRSRASTAPDRLSSLPDAVLARVLSSLDLRDAVHTSVLSRRWRALWREADGVNLDTRLYRDDDYDGERVGREFFRDALAAVGADGRCPVRRLSVRVDSYFEKDFVREIMRTSPGMDALLAAPAMRRLEELCLELTAEFCQTFEEYVLPASLLPGASLRVLDLCGCTLGPPGAAVFGRLETLKMMNCVTSPEDIQSTLDAAPKLATLWLEGVCFESEELAGSDRTSKRRRRLLLRCAASTVSVTLVHCHCFWADDCVDLDAPGVCTLRYSGFLERFPFRSATASGSPANLQHVELHFCTSRCSGMVPSGTGADEHYASIFWKSVGRFSRLRSLQLELQDISDIAVQPEQQDVFLKVFPDLRFLEVKGSCEKDSHGAAVAIANMFRCCPSMQEFCLKCELHDDPDGFPRQWRIFQNHMRVELDLENSVESHKRNKSGKITTPSSEDDDDMDLSALKTCSFHCLDHHLRKIRIEFELKCFNCFKVKLAKFFVENAAVLEDIEVFDEDQGVYEL